jgi:hypothetical protein
MKTIGCDCRTRVERNYLRIGVDARVSAASGRHSNGMSERRFEGRLDGTLHGRSGTLDAPAGVVRAAVSEGSAETAARKHA